MFEKMIEIIMEWFFPGLLSGICVLGILAANGRCQWLKKLKAVGKPAQATLLKKEDLGGDQTKKLVLTYEFIDDQNQKIKHDVLVYDQTYFSGLKIGEIIEIIYFGDDGLKVFGPPMPSFPLSQIEGDLIYRRILMGIFFILGAGFWAAHYYLYMK